MSQSRAASALESAANVAIISQMAIFPLFGIRITLADNLLIGGYFTIISLARSYIVRRLFNRRAA